MDIWSLQAHLVYNVSVSNHSLVKKTVLVNYLVGSDTALIVLACLSPLNVHLWFLDKLSQDADLVMLIPFKIEAEILRESDLKKIVVQWLFGKTHHVSSLFQGISDQISCVFVRDTFEKSTPSLHFFDYVIYAAFLGTLGALTLFRLNWKFSECFPYGLGSLKLRW